MKDAYDAMQGLLKGEGWNCNITADYAHDEGFTTRKEGFVGVRFGLRFSPVLQLLSPLPQRPKNDS